MSSPWDGLTEAVESARALIAAAAPDDQTAAEGEAYIARITAAALTANCLGHALQQNGLGRALPAQGGPNPDYLMFHAPMDFSRRYRLEGQLNGSERAGVGLYAYEAGGVIKEMGYAAFNRSNADAVGRFALDIAADAQGPGTLAIQPGCRMLLLRVTHRDAAAVPARLSLTGAPPGMGLAQGPGLATGMLGAAGQSVMRSVTEFLRWTAAVQSRPNALLPPTPELAEAVNGEPMTQYFLGYFDLAAGEWLEILMPETLPGYWSLHAYNHWFEHLQTQGLHDANAVAEADGRIRARIGPAVPAALPNRIDTRARRRGALICRLIGAATKPDFPARVVAAKT